MKSYLISLNVLKKLSNNIQDYLHTVLRNAKMIQCSIQHFWKH